MIKKKGRRHKMGKKVKVQIGDTFGKLTVKKRVENNKNAGSQFLCVCECGEMKIIRGTSLKNTKSCGCIRRKRKGIYSTRIYRIYRGMKTRCYNENVPHYKNYGGRGIKICDEWLNEFRKFYEWSILNGYKKNLQIDRIDNDGPYSPENCAWKTPTEQNRNRRNNRLIPYKGKEYCITELAKLAKVSRTTIEKWHGRGKLEERFQNLDQNPE